jgi:hypothetical protein
MALLKLSYTQIKGAPVNVLNFGADATGATNSSAAIQQALDVGGYVVFPPGTYKVGTTLNIPSNIVIDFGSAIIIADTGSTPVLSIDTKTDIVLRNGKFYSGTASAWVAITGTGTGASTPGTYAKNIWIDSIYVESPHIEWILDASNSVRHVFIDNCYFEANNGLKLTNKVVEFSMSNSFLFNQGGSGTRYGIKVTAPAGGSANAEGVNISNTTIDFFTIGLSFSDLYQFTMSQGYLGGGGGTKSIEYTEPSTPLGLLDHTYLGVNFNNQVTLGTFSTGRSLRLIFDACTFAGVSSGTSAVACNANAYNVSILGCNFVNNTGLTGVNVANNSGSITVRNSSFDSTHTKLAVIGATNGGNVVIKDNVCPLATPITQNGPAICQNNGYQSDISSNTLTGTNITAGTGLANEFAGSCGFQLGKGEKGLLTISINAVNTTAGNLKLIVSSGSINFLTGTNIPLPVLAASTNMTYVLPYEMTADANVGVGLYNASAGTVTLAADSTISMVRL